MISFKILLVLILFVMILSITCSQAVVSTSVGGVGRLDHEDAVLTLTFSPDSTVLATASWDGTVRLWDPSTGRQRAILEHDGSVYALAFSPDSKRIVTGSEDKTVRVWDVSNGKELLHMVQDDAVVAVAFSPNESMIASSGFDNTTRLWDATTGEELASFAHPDAVGSVAFSPDGKYLATACKDGSARVFDISNLKPIKPTNDLSSSNIETSDSTHSGGSQFDDDLEDKTDVASETLDTDPLKDIPFPYYMRLKPADTNNILDIIRFGNVISGYTKNMDIYERATFYQWYFKNHGFNVSFAYADDFGSTNKPHLWLLVKTKKEVIEMDPSFDDMGTSCMEPLEPEYTKYDDEFEDVFELARFFEGTNKISWWKSQRGEDMLTQSLDIARREQIMNLLNITGMSSKTSGSATESVKEQPSEVELNNSVDSASHWVERLG